MTFDKAFWQAIVDADFAVPDGHSVAELTPYLLEFLGSSDIDVRDPFGYEILAQWIVRDKHYTPDELRAIRDQLVANLTDYIGEQGTDSVFLRSFSVLMLSVIVYYENQVPFMSPAEMQDLLRHGLDYLRAEQDLRGYIPGKGWAHSCAHTADLLKFLARSSKTSGDDLQTILNAVTDKLLQPVNYVYTHNEDERLVLAVLDVLKREVLTLESWQNWLRMFTLWKHEHSSIEAYRPEIAAPIMNGRHFLSGLYFQLEFTPGLSNLAQTLKTDVLETIKTFR